MTLLKIRETKTSILPLGAESFSTSVKRFDKICLLYVGTFNGRKLGETIKGFARFYRDYNKNVSMEYHIVGSGNKEEEKKIKDQIKTENLNQNLFLYGRKTHNQIGKFFDMCNIGVSFVPITPYYNVQPPTKTFEYLCSGMAVIATNTYENKLVINDSNGVLTGDNSDSFYEGLIKLFNKRFNLSSQNILNNSKKYNWEKIVDSSFLPIIENVIAEE